jgi:hypothetical protein
LSSSIKDKKGLFENEMNKYRLNLTNNMDKNFVEQLIRCNILLKEHSDKQIEEKRVVRKKVLHLENQLSIKDKTIEEKQNQIRDLENKFLLLQSKFDYKENSNPKNYFIDETQMHNDDDLTNSAQCENIESPKYSHPDLTNSMFKTPEVEATKKRKIPFATFTKKVEAKQARLSDLIKPVISTVEIHEIDEVEVAKPVITAKSKATPVVYNHVYDGLGGHKKVLNTHLDGQGQSKTNRNMTKFKVTKSPFTKR